MSLLFRSASLVLLWILISRVKLSFGFFNLTILHTNDCSDRIEEFSGSGSTCTPEIRADDGCFGGVARRSTVLKDIREGGTGNESIILLDTGDQFQGTDWFYVYKGNSTAHFMNLLEYDVMGLSKNEFLRGVPGLIPFLNLIDFPAVSSNIDTSNEPALQSLLSRSRVITVGGEKVGVVGVTKPDTPQLTPTGNLTFLPVIESVQAAVDNLVDDQGVNKIIALSDSSFDIDQEIARSVRGVDIVVGGHFNTFLYTGDPPYDDNAKKGDYPLVINPSYNDSLEVLVVTAYRLGKYLGYLEVTFDDDGVVTSYAGNPIVLDKNVEEDPFVLEQVETYKVLVDKISTTVVGSSDVELSGRVSVCGVGECNLGNMLSDSMRLFHGTENELDIAITSAGSFASSIEQGNITISDLTRTLPYGDTIDILSLTGRSIMDILERSVEDFDISTPSTAFLQLSGVKVEFNLDRGNGERVESVELLCDSCEGGYTDIDVDGVYLVAMNSYIAGGQEGYTIILDRTISRETGNLDVDVAADFLRENYPFKSSIPRIVFSGSSMLKAPIPWVLFLLCLCSLTG
ncbi:snake venom 5'-nucleotidase-like [Lytechinus pictus]|uniref:snake venom 5'-nucleotidase-like n=1 Tax=Lytechinus pictus TaxID=7653 RepID=UPI0030BA1DCC